MFDFAKFDRGNISCLPKRREFVTSTIHYTPVPGIFKRMWHSVSSVMYRINVKVQFGFFWTILRSVLYALDTTVHTWVKSSSKSVQKIIFSGWNVAFLSLQSSRVLQCYCFDSCVMQSCWMYRRDMKKVSIVFWNFYVICRSSAQTKNNTVRHYKGPR